MVTDIVKGTFKGFALLRQVTTAGAPPRPVNAPPVAPMAQPRPVYAPGYGLIPPSQVSARGMRGTHCWAWWGVRVGLLLLLLHGWHGW